MLMPHSKMEGYWLIAYKILLLFKLTKKPSLFLFLDPYKSKWCIFGHYSNRYELKMVESLIKRREKAFLDSFSIRLIVLK